MKPILTQEERDRILSQIDAGALSSSRKDGKKNGGVQTYDIAGLERIVRGRMPVLELLCERFARTLQNRLTRVVGDSCTAKHCGLGISKYSALVKSLPLPSSIFIFRMPPLTGYGLLIPSSALVFRIVELLFGSKSRTRSTPKARELTAIEMRIMTKVSTEILDCFKEAWEPVSPIDVILVRAEENPLAVPGISANEAVVVSDCDVELLGETSRLSLCIPYSSLSPLREVLSSGLYHERQQKDSSAMNLMESHLRQVQVNMRAEIATGKIAVRDFLNLSPGDVISLKPQKDGNATVYIENCAKYLGKIGAQAGYRAIQLISAIANKK